MVADGSVWHVSSPQTEASAFWPAWTSLGQPGGAAAVAASAATLADNRAEVFAVEIPSGTPAVGFGTYGKLWHRWQVARSGQGGNRSACPPGSPLARRRWRHTRTAGSNCSPTLMTPVCGTGCCGQPPIPFLVALGCPARNGTTARGHVARGGGGRYRQASPDRQRGYQVWHTAQTAADADTWTQWSRLATVPGSSGAADGGKLGAPAVGFNQAGLVEIFVVDGSGGGLYHLQATASGQLTLGPQTFPPP